MSIPSAKEIALLGDANLSNVVENLRLLHAAAAKKQGGRKVFAYACFAFDACVLYLIKYPASPCVDKIDALRLRLFGLISSTGGQKWMHALDALVRSGESKPLDPHYATEVMCFGEITDDYYLMYNHSTFNTVIAGAVNPSAPKADPPSSRVVNTANRAFANISIPRGPLNHPTSAPHLARAYKMTEGEMIVATAIYMRKRFRGAFRISFKNGLAYRADNKLFTTERTFVGRDGRTQEMTRVAFIYAMSKEKKYDNALFAAPTTLKGIDKSADYYACGLGQFDIQHSSFFKGQPVLCAGNVRFIDGALERIDNGSGHYKPRPSDLFAAAEVLVTGHKIRLDLRVGGPPGHAPEVSVWGWAPEGAVVTFDLKELVAAGCLNRRGPRDVMPKAVQFADNDIKVLDNDQSRLWWMRYRLNKNLDGAWN